MDFVSVSKSSGTATLTLTRNKVNALNDEVVKQLHDAFKELEKDSDTKALILTGSNSFFSFGFDIPQLLTYSKENFTKFLKGFTELYTYMFTYPKPIIAAINGHAIAGGCMLALACDKRFMVERKAKISLNEITFGASIFSGSTEMLRFCVGSKNATEILYSGDMYNAQDAFNIGLIDKITTNEKLVEDTESIALNLGNKLTETFASLKLLLRAPIAEEMRKREKQSIQNFVDIWYSDSTFENLKKIKIY
ncbi:MAG: enoyl-CoA hydratase/isomerase family protein [Ignavibacteria bacterium]|jgi:enoyl-CoA hydratase/carnithine racemase